MRAWVCHAVYGGLGALLVVAGAVLLGEGDNIVKTLVKATLDLTDPESDGYEYFVSATPNFSELYVA